MCLKQLEEAWSTGLGQTSEAWSQEAQRLECLRDRLNKVVHHLHRKHQNGLSAHFAIGIKVRDEGLADRVRFSWPSSEAAFSGRSPAHARGREPAPGASACRG